MCPSTKILRCFQTVFSLASGFINKVLKEFVGLVLVGVFGFLFGFFGGGLIYYCYALLTVTLFGE